MLIFRILYSAVVITVFIFFRDKLGIDLMHGVAYSLGVIFAILFVEALITDFKNYKLVGGVVGATVFLIIAYYIVRSLETVFDNEALKLGFYFLVMYLGVLVGHKSHWMVESVFNKLTARPSKPKYSSNPKVLDTSTLIDGRIADIVDTGFIEGAIIIPMFVLKELQNVADSHDHLRRQKGRRGLNVLKRLQEQSKINVEIDNTDFKDIGTVDEKLVALGKKVKGDIITTDFNLIKVAEIQNVGVLNINNLAIALRQTILPGEDFSITVVKEGKEHSQGVGYLDDGTMVVVENGRKLIGDTVKVMVTSLLQSESGRIIFTRVKS